MDVVMQRDNESGRVVVQGNRVDDGTRCTVVAVQERGGTWALYPHGLSHLGARLGKDDATTLAQKILDAQS